MADLGTAYVQIIPSAQGISGSISKMLGPESKAAGTASGVGIATAIGGSLSKAGGAMMKAGGIATALSLPLVAGMKKSMDAYNVQKAAETKLTEIYKTRMGVSDQAAKKTTELASALQKQGVVGDEVTLSGAQQLATFAQYPDTVNKLLPAMNNLLVQQKGVNATSQDATGIANMMGKVMGGQVGALKRVGITFDENSEKILKNGTEQEKAAELAKVITQNVGEMNTAFAETPEGKMQQLRNTMSDLAERLGGTLAPVLSDIATFVSDSILPKVEQFIGFMESNPIVDKIVVGIAGVLAVGGPLLIFVGTLAKAAGAIITTIGMMSAPMLAIVAGIAGLAAVLILAWNNSETFRTAVQNAASAIGSALAPVVQMVMQAFSEMAPIVMQIAGYIGDMLGGAINLVTPLIVALVNTLASYLKPALKVLQAALTLLAAAFGKVASVMSKHFASASKAVGNACKFIQKNLSFSAVVGKVSSVFNSVKTKISTAISNAKSKVDSAVKSVKKYLSFSGLAAAVKSTFDGIKEKITEPINSAKETVSKVVKTIQGWFPISIGKVMSGIKLPVFKKEGKFSLNPPSVPKFSLSWKAKAMENPYLYSGATIFGAGEAGDEMLYGHAKLMNDISNAVSNAGTSGQTVYINNTITVDGAENPEDFAERFVRRLKLDMRTA